MAYGSPHRRAVPPRRAVAVAVAVFPSVRLHGTAAARLWRPSLPAYHLRRTADQVLGAGDNILRTDGKTCAPPLSESRPEKKSSVRRQCDISPPLTVSMETATMNSDDIFPAVRSNSTPSRQTLRYRFDLIDRDGNGLISGQELAEVMRQLGHHVTDAEITEIMSAVDLDGDGNICFEEFVVAYSQTRTQMREQEERAMREAFKVFDRNRRGFIGVSDLRMVLHCLGERLTDEEVEDIIEEVDIDGDGRIDFDEFVRAVTEESDVEEAEE